MKTELRSKYKSLRKQLSPLEQENYSKIIAGKLLQQFDLKGKNISIFIPIKQFNEIDTWKIIDNVKASFFLPVMERNDLKHINYTTKDQLKPNGFGVPEPQNGKEIEPKELDFVIVPLLAFDIKGNRVGYGKGFYDRFLKDCSSKCIKIGISYFNAEPNLIQTISSDIPLDYCINPNEIYQFKKLE